MKAKQGVRHWWMQRLSAAALVPLTVWFVVWMVALAGADRAAAVDWLGSPFSFGVMVLFVVVSLHHAQLGLRVVVEDYVSSETAAAAAIVLVQIAAAALGLAAVAALSMIAFRG